MIEINSFCWRFDRSNGSGLRGSRSSRSGFLRKSNYAIYREQRVFGRICHPRASESIIRVRQLFVNARKLISPARATLRSRLTGTLHSISINSRLSYGSLSSSVRREISYFIKLLAAEASRKITVHYIVVRYAPSYGYIIICVCFLLKFSARLCFIPNRNQANEGTMTRVSMPIENTRCRFFILYIDNIERRAEG